MTLFDLNLDDLENFIESLGEKKYRAKQIFLSLYKDRVTSYDEMTTLKKEFRDLLKEKLPFPTLELVNRQVSTDTTEKFLFRLSDNNLIETVLMPHDYGYSLCVSSQVGCPMACSFCASGAFGFKRNLETYEMVKQVLDVEKYSNKKISSVVIMGIGEPFLNYDNVIKFIRIINNDFGIAIGARHITLSTSGILPKFKDFEKEKFQVNLAISLHASNNELRNKLMPVNKKYPLEDLIDAIKTYIENTNRRVTIEYILLDGINDLDTNAKELAKLLRGLNVYVNLIPYNETSNNDYKRSKRTNIFFDLLKKEGLNVTVRKEHGHDIDAACGQLRGKMIKGE
ncbi:MAG: 23S rRNA (adenine(2503)-C(2))-methyltransferase RlmN [Acholeplasmatales bacterium]|nr:23S rRNA (adenine(2503)-C(2))-methyltransferase RlmN [Acholeplasmatales bacterium]